MQENLQPFFDSFPSDMPNLGVKKGGRWQKKPLGIPLKEKKIETPERTKALVVFDETKKERKKVMVKVNVEGRNFCYQTTASSKKEAIGSIVNREHLPLFLLKEEEKFQVFEIKEG
ncbi:hypothetical protein L6252_00775 [Candidatus Parcubacteria bacterium]|nr:hypothetical protein [Candidatus Parcubacteria bacterium]